LKPSFGLVVGSSASKDTLVMTKLSPSGGVFSTVCTPMMPPAPARVSTKNCWWNAVVSASAARRARMSAAPPAAKVLTMRTGCVGQSSARADAATESARTAAAAAREWRFTGVSSCSI